MIAFFPNFMPLTIDLRNDFIFFTKNFPCYTEFNFQELFVWNTANMVQVSQLNENLVVLRPDYLTEEPVISFLGSNDINGTCEKLLQYAEELGNKPTLKNIPETTINVGIKKKFRVTPDLNHQDYIIDATEHALLKGKNYTSIREKINRFHQKYGQEVVVKELPMHDVDIQDQFYDLFERWAKSSGKKSTDCEHELLAIRRAFDNSQSLNLRMVGVYVSDVLAASTIQAKIDGDYEVGLFLKADYSFDRIYNYIVLATTRTHVDSGGRYINIEHDLGIEGLRVAKMQLHPKFFFKKCQISYA